MSPVWVFAVLRFDRWKGEHLLLPLSSTRTLIYKYTHDLRDTFHRVDSPICNL